MFRQTIKNTEKGERRKKQRAAVEINRTVQLEQLIGSDQ
jgi:hypothetical protein